MPRERAWPRTLSVDQQDIRTWHATMRVMVGKVSWRHTYANPCQAVYLYPGIVEDPVVLREVLTPGVSVQKQFRCR